MVNIPADHLVNVCKYRQGATCCRYIVFSGKMNDFICVKKTSLRAKIDEVPDMVAKGDNCDGLSCDQSVLESM